MTSDKSRSVTFKFSEPLLKGVIISRPNSFLMEVKINTDVVLCHCPVTGKIGSISFTEVPCLVSKHSILKRKHIHTVEAIFINRQWIGINQTKINEFVEFYIRNGSFSKVVGGNWVTLKREVVIGGSKFDFLIDNQIIETKLFLNTISSNKNSELSIVSKSSCDRFVQQYKDLIVARKNGYYANIFHCYIFNADKLLDPLLPYYPKEFTDIVSDAVLNGVKHWQVNFEISKSKLKLISYHQI